MQTPYSAPATTHTRKFERQTHFLLAIFLITVIALSVTIKAELIYLESIPIFGLLLDSLTGFCPMTELIKRIPANRPH